MNSTNIDREPLSLDKTILPYIPLIIITPCIIIYIHNYIYNKFKNCLTYFHRNEPNEPEDYIPSATVVINSEDFIVINTNISPNIINSIKNIDSNSLPIATPITSQDIEIRSTNNC